MVPKQKHVHLASWQSQCQRTLYKEKRSKPKVLLVKYHWNHHLVLSLVSRSASAYHHHVSFVLQYHHGPKEVIRHDFTWKMERKWVSKCPKDFEEVTPLRFCLQRWWWNYLRDWSPMTVWFFGAPAKAAAARRAGIVFGCLKDFPRELWYRCAFQRCRCLWRKQVPICHSARRSHHCHEWVWTVLWCPIGWELLIP